MSEAKSRKHKKNDIPFFRHINTISKHGALHLMLIMVYRYQFIYTQYTKTEIKKNKNESGEDKHKTH